MSLMDSVTEDKNVVDDGDRIGGFQIWPSGLYKTKIDEAFMTVSNEGAIGLAVTLKNDKGNIYKEIFWVVGKKGKTYWERDGVRHNIPGFDRAKHLCLLTTGKTLKELEDTVEVKIINERNRDTSEMGQKKVDMVMGLLDQEINVGIIANIVDKNIKDDKGNWVPSGETREQNEIDKFFDSETNLTYSEIKAGKTEPDFAAEWANNWNGKTKNKARGLPGTGNAPATGGAKPATKSLFV